MGPGLLPRAGAAASLVDLGRAVSGFPPAARRCHGSGVEGQAAREAKEPFVSSAILTATLRWEQDLVAVRQRARDVSKLLGFDEQDQTRIATAVSEIGRN